MKLKYDVVIDEACGQMVAVPVNYESDFTGVYMKINSTGAYILNLLKKEITVEDIIAEIQKDFEVDDIEAVKKGVISFIENLKKVDVLA